MTNLAKVIEDSGGSVVAGVSRVNSLSGAVNIVAGQNITVTPSGQNIIIATSDNASYDYLAYINGAYYYAVDWYGNLVFGGPGSGIGGVPGITADTVINACITASPTYAVTTILKTAVSYTIANTLTTHAKTRLIGMGRINVTLNVTTNINCITIAPGEGSGGTVISDLSINENSKTGNAIYASNVFWGGLVRQITINGIPANYSGINIAGIFSTSLEDISINSKGTGLTLTGVAGSGIAYGNSSFYNVSADISGSTNGIGISITGLTGSPTNSLNYWYSTRVFGGNSGGIGIYITNDTTDAAVFEAVQLESQGAVGVKIDGGASGNSLIEFNGGWILGSSGIGFQFLNDVEGITVIKWHISVATGSAITDASTGSDYGASHNYFDKCTIACASITLTNITELQNCRIGTLLAGFTVTTSQILLAPSLLGVTPSFQGLGMLGKMGIVLSGHNCHYGTALFLNSAGTYIIANSTSIAAMPAVGVVAQLFAGSDWQSGYVKILTNGIMRNDTWTWTVGGLIYVSTSGTNNNITQTPPAGSGKVVQIIGIALTATIIYFNVSLNYTVNP